MTAVLVTGGARRIGRAVASFLAGRGMTVAVHCHHSVAEATSLVDEIAANGGNGFVVQGNLADESDVLSLLEEANQRSGGLHVLVNNASVFSEDHVLDLTFGSLMENMMVNAYSPLLLSREFARDNAASCIVNMLDSRVVDYDSIHASYHLSKRVLSDVTRMLALELAPQVRVNAVAPGLILPPEGKGDAYVDARKQELPLKKKGTVAQVCSAVDFLIENEFVTGQTVFVDGGRHLNGAIYQ
ncbi:MAG: SDR family oxidoreductase [Deltaproteobacteria bacterium]|nr:SDR family oxidoreductase [Deltaproteobacteria bacterium]MBN2671502.1 SDR family oxidoreductase [Deltaproteobacteria bacterium]